MKEEDHDGEIPFARVCPSLLPLTRIKICLAEADLDLLKRQAPARPFLLLRKREAVVEKEDRDEEEIETDRRNGARTHRVFALPLYFFLHSKPISKTVTPPK